MDRDFACIRCHAHKMKCRRPQNQSTCLRCTKFNFECKPRPPKRQNKNQHRFSPPTPAITPSALTPTNEPRTEESISIFPPVGEWTNSSLSDIVDDGLYDFDITKLTSAREDVNMHDWYSFISANQSLEQPTPSSSRPFELSIDGESPQLVEDLAATDSDPVLLRNARPCMANTTEPNLGGLRRVTDGTRTEPSNAPTLDEWVQSLTNLISRLLIPANGNGDCYVSALKRSHGDEEATVRGTRDEHKVQEVFALAKELSTLIKQSDAISRERNVSELRFSKVSQQGRKASRVLQDDSNSILLLSAYLRLLGVFSSLLEEVEAFMDRDMHSLGADSSCGTTSPESHRGGPFGSLHLTNQPIAECFMIVNMMELSIQRANLALRIPSPSHRQTTHHEHRQRGMMYSTQTSNIRSYDTVRDDQHDLHDNDEHGAGMKALAPMIVQQQSNILRMANRLRAQLLMTPDIG